MEKESWKMIAGGEFREANGPLTWIAFLEQNQNLDWDFANLMVEIKGQILMLD